MFITCWIICLTSHLQINFSIKRKSKLFKGKAPAEDPSSSSYSSSSDSDGEDEEIVRGRKNSLATFEEEYNVALGE